MLAGLNIPISEDLMVILSGILAATVVPQNTLILYAAVFFGAYLSAWLVYWIGRKLGIKLLRFKWFKKTIPIRKLAKIKLFYKNYGFYTLLIGRFIPFGVRNCLFFTAGLTKMNFFKFIIKDILGCFLSTGLLFTLSYTLGRNFDVFYNYIKKVNLLIFALFIFTIITLICYYMKKKRKQEA
jgi:membrane protein DedA with SNARE-associated domain